MFALLIGSDNYILEYRYCTLHTYANTPSLYKDIADDGTRWVWIDKTVFWSDDEYMQFVNNYRNYYYIASRKTIRPRYQKNT